jgi:tetratricopeptide (TPR) repeat protein
MRRLFGIKHAEFSPDGRYVVTSWPDKATRVWDVATGKLVKEQRHTQDVYYTTFSPDSKRSITASGNEAQVWEAFTFQPITKPMRHSGPVYHAAFSRDGRYVVTASADRTARVWDAATGNAISAPLKHPNGVDMASFSPDGQLVLTSSIDGAARVWDITTGELLLPPMKHLGELTHVAFSPDGRRVVTSSTDFTARVWDLPSRVSHSLADLRLMASLLASHRIDETSALTPLDSSAVANAFDTLHTNSSFAAGVTPKTLREWHSQEAKDSENRKQWFAAAWHLSWMIDAEPADGILHRRRGRAHTELSDWVKAEADYTKAIEQQVADQETWFQRGRARAHLKKWDTAREDFARAVELDPKDGAGWFALHHAHAELGHWEEAETAFAKVGDQTHAIQVRSDHQWGKRFTGPDDPVHWQQIAADFTKVHGIGARFMPKADEDEGWRYRARGLCNAVLAHWGESADDHARRPGLWAEAADDYRHACDKKPNDWHAWRGLAFANAKLRNWRGADDACTRAIQLKNEEGRTWYLRGIARAGLRRFEEAVSDYSHAIDLGTNGWAVWVARAGAHAELCQWDKALADFAQSRQQSREDQPEVLCQEALARLGNRDGNGFRKACADLLQRFGDTSSAETANLTAWTCLLIPDVVSDKDRLVELAKWSAEAKPDSLVYLRTLGAALYRADRFDEAVQLLTEPIDPSRWRGRFKPEGLVPPMPRKLEGIGKPKPFKPMPSDLPKPEDGKKVDRSEDGGRDDKPERFNDPPEMVYHRLFLAMVHRRLGNDIEAGNFLYRASQWMDRKGEVQLSWSQRLELKILRREAEAMGIKSIPPTPSRPAK